MQRKHWLMLFTGFLSGALIMALVSCGNGPKVTIYLSDPANGGMEYYNEVTGVKGFVAYSATDKFIAMTQADAETLFNYCGLGK